MKNTPPKNLIQKRFLDDKKKFDKKSWLPFFGRFSSKNFNEFFQVFDCTYQSVKFQENVDFLRKRACTFGICLSRNYWRRYPKPNSAFLNNVVLEIVSPGDWGSKEIISLELATFLHPRFWFCVSSRKLKILDFIQWCFCKISPGEISIFANFARRNLIFFSFLDEKQKQNRRWRKEGR